MADTDISTVKSNMTKDLTKWMDILYKKGRMDERKKTEQILSERNETTVLEAASEYDKEKYSWIGLTAYCSACGKGLAQDAGFYNFCPHCGRKIIKGDTKCPTE